MFVKSTGIFVSSRFIVKGCLVSKTVTSIINSESTYMKLTVGI